MSTRKEYPMKERDKHIIDALATYICVQSIQQQKFMGNISIMNISKMFYANEGHKDKAFQRAWQMIRDFK